jgi:ABC-type bacteriocin/lantibiotic exporter with double-glycine peptidase domain
LFIKNQAENKMLIEFSRMLGDENKTLADFGLPPVIDDSTELNRERLKHSPLLESTLFARLCESKPNNAEQDVVLDKVKEFLNIDSTKFIFVQGQAGSGKTELAKKIMAFSRSQGSDFFVLLYLYYF